jgi:hypothetical protein
LDSSVDIPKFLQGVADVPVGFGEIGIYPNTLLVVEYAFRKITKLEMNRPEKQQIVRAVGVLLVKLFADPLGLLILARVVQLVRLRQALVEVRLGGLLGDRGLQRR